MPVFLGCMDIAHMAGSSFASWQHGTYGEQADCDAECLVEWCGQGVRMLYLLSMQ